MKVREIMRSEVRSVGPAVDLSTAGRIMEQVDCGVLPVVGAEERVVGMLTDRDLCLTVTRHDLRPSRLRVRQAMSAPVRTCSETEEVAEALETMARFRVRRLPVVDPEGRMVGLLCLDDVVLHARPALGEIQAGPYEAEVARTLRSICEHATPVLTA